MAHKTRVLVIANCQAPFIARSLELLNPGIVARNMVVFQADKTKTAQYRQAMENSDFVFHFNVKPGFMVPELEARSIKAALGSRSMTITNLFFSGLHPDFCYVGPMNRRVQGPFGEYHSRFALAGYKLGLSAAETATLIGDAGLQEMLGYRDAFEKSVDELRRRDEDHDIRFSALLEPMLKGAALPMYTFNHPAPWVMLEFGRHILNQIGLEADRLPYEVLPPWLQSGPILPVYRSAAEWHGLNYVLERWKQPGTNAWLGHEDAIALYYDSYKDIPDEALTFEGDAAYLQTLKAELG